MKIRISIEYADNGEAKEVWENFTDPQAAHDWLTDLVDDLNGREVKEELSGEISKEQQD